MMDQSIQKEYLNEHIPYRMRFIKMLEFACKTLLMDKDKEPGKVEILFDSKTVLGPGPIYLITNPFLEIGTLYSRVMLDFLGINRDGTKNNLKERKGRKNNDDIIIEDFDLPTITQSEATNIPFEQDKNKVEKALISVITLADKGVAHLTKNPVELAGLSELYLASRVVPWLVCEYLYKRKGLQEPFYEL